MKPRSQSLASTDKPFPDLPVLLRQGQTTYPALGGRSKTRTVHQIAPQGGTIHPQIITLPTGARPLHGPVLLCHVHLSPHTP